MIEPCEGTRRDPLKLGSVSRIVFLDDDGQDILVVENTARHVLEPETKKYAQMLAQSTPVYQLRKFTIDDNAHFWGWTDGRHWNGWETPMFTFPQACEVLKCMMSLGDQSYRWEYESSEDVFRVWGDGSLMNECVGFVAATITGEPIELYDISNGWCWDLVEGQVPLLRPEI
jgi:hypothetical protein